MKLRASSVKLDHNVTQNYSWVLNNDHAIFLIFQQVWVDIFSKWATLSLLDRIFFGIYILTLVRVDLFYNKKECWTVISTKKGGAINGAGGIIKRWSLFKTLEYVVAIYIKYVLIPGHRSLKILIGVKKIKCFTKWEGLMIHWCAQIIFIFKNQCSEPFYRPLETSRPSNLIKPNIFTPWRV